MKNNNLATRLLLFLVIWFAIPGNAQVSTGSLLEEMINLQQLADFPSPVFQTIQFSSYDRHSIAPDQPGWFSNADGFGGETIPGFEEVIEEPGENGIGKYLVCDVKGPGAVVRLWTAMFTGELEVYLDGNESALYHGPAQDFFYSAYDAISESEGQFNQEGLFWQNTAGYYPIPFANRFRMVWKGKLKDLHFYHVQVRLYEAGTEVRSFKTGDLKKFRKQIERVSRVLLNPASEIPVSGQKKVLSGRVEAGQEKVLGSFYGEKAITHFMVKVLAEQVPLALRQNILKIRYDGASSAQVQAPVGDFFGAAPGINPFHSLPFSVLPDGSMICRFYMPFQDSASIEIQNLGEIPVYIFTEVYTEPIHWDIDRSMYFRARWRIDHGLLASYDPVQDIPYLHATGKGVCVGAAAYLYNPTSVPSSWGNWWGEGDEKLFIDQGSFPAFYGTGSEDYFNYAWSSSAIFTHAYCGQPRNDGPANRGFVSNYRWHILDRIPFTTGIAFYMELFSHEPVENFSYGRMVYLYARPGIYDDHLPLTREDLRELVLPDKWYPVGRKGSRNARFFQAELLAENRQEIGLEHRNLWSGGAIMVWEPVSGAQVLKLNLPVDKAGRYVIVLTGGMDMEGGVFQVETGDEMLEFNGSEKINLHDPHRVLSRNFNSKPVSLETGMIPLLFIPSDGNKGKIKIDFIWLMESR
jgi:hypothetical protein